MTKTLRKVDQKCFIFLLSLLKMLPKLKEKPPVFYSRSSNIPTISSFLYFLLTIWFATIQIQIQPNPARGPSSLALNVLPFNAFFYLGLETLLACSLF
jgi:hypothetical protein